LYLANPDIIEGLSKGKNPMVVFYVFEKISGGEQLISLLLVDQEKRV